MNPRNMVAVFRCLKSKLLEEFSASDIDDESILGCIAIAAQSPSWEEEGYGNYWAINDNRVNLALKVYKNFKPMSIDELIAIINAHGEGMTASEYDKLRRNRAMLEDTLTALWQEPNPYIRHIQITEWLKIHQYEIKT